MDARITPPRHPLHCTQWFVCFVSVHLSLIHISLRRYIDELSVTGLTSNPSIFDHAIKNSNFYNDAIRQKMKEGKSGDCLLYTSRCV